MRCDAMRLGNQPDPVAAPCESAGLQQPELVREDDGEEHHLSEEQVLGHHEGVEQDHADENLFCSLPCALGSVRCERVIEKYAMSPIRTCMHPKSHASFPNLATMLPSTLRDPVFFLFLFSFSMRGRISRALCSARGG